MKRLMLGICWVMATLTAQAQIPFGQPQPPAPVTSEAGLALAKLKPEQANKVELANEYFRRGEYTKAQPLYKDLAKDNELIPYIHKNYLVCLKETKADEEAERFHKKAVKSYPENSSYRLDQALFYRQRKDEKEVSSLVEKLKKQVGKNAYATDLAAKRAIDLGQYDWAEALYLHARVQLKDPLAFALDMVEVYRASGRSKQMFEELLAFLDRDANALPMVETALSTVIAKPEDREALEVLLLERVQKYPLNTAYNELLYWLYLQKKDFAGAFIQAKAIDRQTRTDATRSMEVANLAVTNGDDETAVSVLAWVTKEYANRPIYYQAQRELIALREKRVKRLYPVPIPEVKNLIADYKALIARKDYPSMLPSMRSMALLYAFYLDQVDTALVLLNEVSRHPFCDRLLADQTKLDLGDLYILKQEPWESALLYAQVEKSQKEAPLGHEAKLRSARLNYFRGDFELAQEHLDVLKQATSREISNDAMDQALLIQDNLAEDSNGTALKDYAAVELLLFRQKDQEALAAIDQILKTYKGQVIVDEALWLKGKILRKMRRFPELIATLEELRKLGPGGLFADDAVFALGQVYELELKDSAQAMKYYEEILTAYPGSILGVEARKRFRTLRGDPVN